jgi:hypothetical protein
MKYYPVYDNGTNDLLGLFAKPIGLHDGAESIYIEIANCGKVNFEIKKISPSPKLDSFFPPRYLVINLSKYDREFEKILRWFLKVRTPNQPVIKE